MNQVSDMLPRLVNVAINAGKYIRSERHNFNYEKAESKGLNDLVSYVDKKAEEMIVGELQGIFSDAGYIVEENTRNERKEFNWIVDPLDGTTNFVHGIPSYAVSIALEGNGKIHAGVVYEISRDECFCAMAGSGAFLNGKRISVSERKTLGNSLIGTGYPVHNFSRMEEYLKAVEFFMRNTHGVRRIGSAATDLCYLACGRLDAFFEYGLQPWDLAAGALIIKEAGGTVCDFSGGENWLFGKELSCTNGLLEEEFYQALRKFFRPHNS